MVQGAVDARVEVVEGQGKEIESGREVWPQMVNTERIQLVLSGG